MLFWLEARWRSFRMVLRERDLPGALSSIAGRSIGIEEQTGGLSEQWRKRGPKQPNERKSAMLVRITDSSWTMGHVKRVILALKVVAFFNFIFTLMCLLPSVCAAGWSASVDQRNGLLIIGKDGSAAMSSDFVFWKNNWVWANLSSQFNVVAPYQYSIVGNDPALNFTLDAQVKRASGQQLVWDFDLNARTTTSDVIRGGIAFNLDLAAFGSELGEPELLPDNRGWSWGQTGRRIEMRFDPPLASLYFEQGSKTQIRAFFYKGEVPQGPRHYVATLTVSGDMAIGPTKAERYGLDNQATWPADILDWRTAPVDLSFLNAPERPAGKHGFLRTAKDKLIFEDGTPVRFWGTNLTASALFGTTSQSVKLQARRLSELGFNLVRIHHHDSDWVVPNIFGGKTAMNTQSLSQAMLEKLDWWITCLEQEGIYVWLDLHVGRQLKPADGIDGFSEISKGKPVADLKGYNYVNVSIQRAMQRFNEEYVGHRNRFNGLAYKDDRGIVTLLLTNENDVTHHFGNRMLPDKHVPQHNALYMAQADAFATKFGLARDKVWRSWEHGPSKLFLNDLEQRFDADMIRQLRNIGVKVPIVTTSIWGDDPLSSLPALLTGDIVDAHAYGGIDDLEQNPLYTPTFVDSIAAAHVIDRPLSVSEWNVSPFPTPDRHTSPLYVAGAASLQGWVAPMQFAYSQQALNNRGRPSNWDAFNDPSLMGTLPAAALLFRRGDVQEAKTTYVFAPRPDQLFNQIISPKTSVALRTAVEKGKLVIAMPQTAELPWLEKSQIPDGAQVITDPNRSLIDANATNAISDTMEVRRDWEQGTYTIDTPRSQVATGWIGGRQISLADVEIALTTQNASVAVQSLDQGNIGDAHAIQISLGARSIPDPRNPALMRSEPVTGRLTIRAIRGLRLYKQFALSTGHQELPVTYEAGRYQINLDRNLGTYWLQLR
jgi:hypothetical protein